MLWELKSTVHVLSFIKSVVLLLAYILDALPLCLIIKIIFRDFSKHHQSTEDFIQCPFNNHVSCQCVL